MPFEAACAQIQELGYEGVEIAPYTLAEDATGLTPEERARIRGILESSKLQLAGMHWLLASPPGLHATSRDEAVRKTTWDYVHGLIDLCADLSREAEGASPVLVFGSPKQRSSSGGMTAREATDIFTHELAHTAPHAESRGVTIALEALSADQTDVVTSLGEAVAIVKQIGSPAIQTMFDTHNAVQEKEAHTDLLHKYFPYIRHVHVNEMDGREPGSGNYDFAGLLAALGELNYSGWVSLETFEASKEPASVAKRSLQYLESQIPRPLAARNL